MLRAIPGTGKCRELSQIPEIETFLILLIGNTPFTGILVQIPRNSLVFVQSIRAILGTTHIPGNPPTTLGKGALKRA